MSAVETDKLREQLTQFGQSQLGNLKPAQIAGITAHLVVSVAFFTGAIIYLASMRGIKKSHYLPALQDYLSDTFGLPANHAVGLVESNARLYKRYNLIENIYKQGWQTAQAWNNTPSQVTPQLESLLQEHKDLSMSALSLEGIKEEKAAPKEVEEIAPMPEPVIEAKRPFPWVRVVWLLVLLGSSVGAYYWRESILRYLGF
jgi:hypothetical protein